MQVIRAETAGFCMGVSLALRRLDQALRDYPERRIVTLGPIIHNPQVLEAYARQGVYCAQNTEEILADDCVLIRAHGIPRTVQATLESSGALVLDATCPKVKDAQLAIERATQGGIALLLFGEKDHPEVQGLLSYAQGEWRVCASEQEFEQCEIMEKELILAAQTTQDQHAFERIAVQLQSMLGKKASIVYTICNATQKRQEEVVRIAGMVDLMLVVGGRNSGNTRRLAEISQSLGVPTLHIETPDEIKKDFLQKKRLCGLTAGASTPKSIIDEAQTVLENYL